MTSLYNTNDINTLNYHKGSGSGLGGYYKIAFAILTAQYTESTQPYVANFTATPTSGTPPLTVSFTDLSNGASEWAWDFENDGTVDSTRQNPTHTYNTPGIYTVKLNATWPGTITQTIIGYIKVESPDLMVNQVTYNPNGLQQLFVGEDNNIQVTIMNNGNCDAGSFDVNLNLGSYHDTQSISNLAAGRETTVTFRGFTPLINGTVTVNVTVDSNNEIAESNENNNLFSESKPSATTVLKVKGTPMAVILTPNRPLKETMIWCTPMGALLL